MWNTTCAVMNAGKSTKMACTVLISPANPQLSGVSKFPYFPLGGPAPKEYPKKDAHHIMGHVSQWGGMEVGNGMMFAANVVDGLVHQLGGWKLAYECRLVPIVKQEEDDERCPVGESVITGPGGSKLSEHFEHIVHTVPPFYNHHPDPEKYLLECYKQSLSLAFEKSSRVACPLLGSGCRGFPMETALNLAGQASVDWRDQDKNSGDIPQSLAFAIPDPAIAEEMAKAIEAVDGVAR